MPAKITIEARALFVYVIALFLVPFPWIFGFIISVLIHELGHLLVLKLYNVQIFSVEIGIAGAKITTVPLDNLVEALCAIAGPIAGLFPLLLAKSFPRIALIGLIQSCYNLLPVYPLDGGRVLHCLLLKFVSAKAAAGISNCTSILVVVIFALLGVWISVAYSLGWIPVIFPTVPLLFALKNTLQSCKKNSTIHGRTKSRGNQYDFFTAKIASASAKTCTVHRRRVQ